MGRRKNQIFYFLRVFELFNDRFHATSQPLNLESFELLILGFKCFLSSFSLFQIFQIVQAVKLKSINLKSMTQLCLHISFALINYK